MSSFAISCGGTGGHLSPGIALAERLTERGHRCRLLISQKDVDSRLIQKYPKLEFVRAPGAGFGMGLLALLRFGATQLASFFFSLNYLRRTRPDVIVGFGGFLTAGISLAGYLMGIPLVLHEANRRPGRAVRMLSGFARRIYLPPGVRLRGLPPQALRHCGFPVRQEIHREAKAEARARLGLPAEGVVLLVLGGSQGATAFNEWVTKNFPALAARGVNVVCVTGLGKHDDEVVECAGPGGRKMVARFLSFCDDMATLLSSADLAVSRAGAGSLAEFVRCRLPAVLVPYPFAADNHQWENARCFERQGGGLVLDAKDIDRLLSEVLELIFNEFLLDSFCRNLERMERSNSLDVLLHDLEELAVEGRQYAADEITATA
jgi:UDP-N-acetylglucosamine--N-acetylmuramyl-(pentapeptide) pyrophosphoryl-undecaprenol N-acetylglucosamine transferase